MFRHILGAELKLSVARFDQDEKEEALDYQVALERRGRLPDGLDEIVRLFGELCDRWPEVLDLRYGGTRADFREFRTEFLPALLDALVLWTESHADADLLKTVEDASKRYCAAVRVAEGTSVGQHEQEEEEDDEG